MAEHADIQKESLGVDLSFTTVVAIDDHHAKELLTVMPSWVVNRPEIMLHPFVLIHDPKMLPGLLRSVVANLKHPNIKVVPAREMPDATQRAMMLTALTLQAPWLVDTEWMLKIDTDCLATRWDPTWCKSDMVIGQPSFVASPWNYTRPSNAIQILDDWGDTVQELQDKPRMDIAVEDGSEIVQTPGRIISYVFFGRAEALRHISTFVNGPTMPLASQDTYTWYVARRLGLPYQHVKMKNFGWEHLQGGNLANKAQNVNLAPRVKAKPYRETVANLVEQFTARCGGCDRRQANMVEIGVSTGELSAYLLANFTNLNMALVDPWGVYQSDSAYVKSGDQMARKNQEEQQERLCQTINRVGFAWPRVSLFRSTSVAAAPRIHDGSIDIVFVDGNHSYEAVKADLETYWRKVRAGGYLAGHDFLHPRYGGVEQAAAEFAANHSVKLETGPGTVFWMRKP